MKQKKRWTLKDKLDREIKLRNENSGYNLATIELGEIKRKKKIEELRKRLNLCNN